jgi:hypothetical protein
MPIQGMIEGFDLGPIRHFHLTSATAIDICRHHNIVQITRPIPIFNFDFQHVTYDTREETFTVPVIAPGSADGIIVWWKLIVDESIEFTTGPECNTHWSQMVTLRCFN